jgi:CheY-like chemotaxis protein
MHTTSYTRSTEACHFLFALKGTIRTLFVASTTSDDSASKGALHGARVTRSRGNRDGQSDRERPITVLMVEDSPFDYELFLDQLDTVETVNFELTRCETLAEALAKLEEDGGFDVVLLDLTLPDSNGLDTFSKVHTCAYDTPIVILTGIEERSLSLNALENGAANYLIKQKVSPDRIAAAIMSALTRRA